MCVCFIMKNGFFVCFLEIVTYFVQQHFKKLNLHFFSCRISYNCMWTGFCHSQKMDKWHAGKDLVFLQFSEVLPAALNVLKMRLLCHIFEKSEFIQFSVIGVVHCLLPVINFQVRM